MEKDVINNRFRCACLVVILFTMAVSMVRGQQADLTKRIRLKETRISFDSLLRNVAGQTGVTFSYNVSKLRLAKSFHIKTVALSLGQFLEEVSANTQLHYTIIGQHIALSEQAARQKPSGEKKTRQGANDPARRSSLFFTTQKPVTKKPPTQQKIVKSSPPPARQPAATRDQPVSVVQPIPDKTIDSLVPDPTRLQPVISSSPAIPVDTAAQKMMTDSSSIVVAPASAAAAPMDTGGRNARSRSGRSFRLHLGPFQARPGFTVDEVFPIGPTLTAGVAPLYGILSWNSNAQVSGFRYGLGSSFRLSSQWNMHVVLTTGKLTRSYAVAVDTFRAKIHTASSHLHRLGLQFEKQFRKRFSVQAGLLYNVLRTKYSIDGVAVTPQEGSPDELYNTIRKPFLNIGNDYRKNRSTHTLSWPGIQLGIFYNINFSRQ